VPPPLAAQPAQEVSPPPAPIASPPEAPRAKDAPPAPPSRTVHRPARNRHLADPYAAGGGLKPDPF